MAGELLRAPCCTLGAGFGVTVIEVSIAAVTDKLTTGVDVTPFKLAVMFVLPTATPVANPCVPAALLIVAAAVFDEFHVAMVVRFCVELARSSGQRW